MTHQKPILLLKSLCISLCLGMAAPLAAQAPSNGSPEAQQKVFPGKTVRTAVKDNRGYLWSASPDGLRRHDGSDVRIYKHDPKNQGSISHNAVFALAADDAGHLWVGTADGVDCYNPETDSFINIDKLCQDSARLANRLVTSLAIDHRQRVWIGTRGGLHVFNTKTSRLTPLFSNNRNIDVPSTNINTIIIHHDRAWVATKAGIRIFDVNTMGASDMNVDQRLMDKELTSATVSQLGSLFLGFADGEISEVVSESKGHVVRDVFDLRKAGLASRINEMSQDRNGNLWVVTDNLLLLIDPRRKELVHQLAISDGLNAVPFQTPNPQPAPNVSPREDSDPLWLTWWAKLCYAAMAAALLYILFRIVKERIHMKAELKLEKMAREKEHELTESKMFFFTNVLHELRTPLSLILMPLEKIASSSEVPDRFKASLSTAYRNASNLMKLVNELMDVSKFEEVRPTLHVKRGEYVSFISEVARGFNDIAEKKNIKLSLRSSSPEIQGWFDADKVEKIVRNLLSNAFKFTPDGGEINLELQVAETSHKQYVDLTVTDNGVGIAREELCRIFDKFYQAKSTACVTHTGSGIGLSLTRTLVDVHRGTISVESAQGIGTVFHVRLPIQRTAYSDEECSASNVSLISEKELSAADYDHIVLDENLGKPELLLIEDNDELRSFLSSEFAAEFSVTEVASGEEGLAIASNLIPDLIISDILLPGRSGLSVCKELKGDIRTSHIPVILLSAKASAEDQIAGLETGADVYISKPFSIRVLKAQIKQVIITRRKLYTRYSQDAYLMPANLTENQLDKEFLERAVDYITNNLRNSQLSVESLAELFNISRSQVYRKIKSLTGQTVVEFIRMVRLKHALTLMEEKKYNFSEIADRSGFNSLSYFTRSFKEQYGKAPSEYLERKKSNE